MKELIIRISHHMNFIEGLNDAIVSTIELQRYGHLIGRNTPIDYYMHPCAQLRASFAGGAYAFQSGAITLERPQNGREQWHNAMKVDLQERFSHEPWW